MRQAKSREQGGKRQPAIGRGTVAAIGGRPKLDEREEDEGREQAGQAANVGCCRLGPERGRRLSS